MPEIDEPPSVGPDGPTQLVAVPKALVSGAPEKNSLPKGIDSKGPLYASVPQEKFEDVAYWVGYSEAAEAFALHEPSAHADSDRAQTGLCTALTEPPVECAQPTLGFAKEHPVLLSKRNRFTGRTAEPTKTTTAKDTSSTCKTSAASVSKVGTASRGLCEASATTVVHSWTPALDATYVRFFTESATTKIQAPDDSLFPESATTVLHS